MTDLVTLYRRATEEFTEHLDAVNDAQWSAPTPCADWDVRTLVNHVVGEQLWAPHLLAGETIADVGDRYDGDVLGDDPKATWRAVVPPAIDAFAVPGALDGTVHLSYGDEDSREYMTQMLTDAAVHGWDLATAIGRTTTIDPETVSILWESWSPREQMLRDSGMFGERVDVPDDADPLTKLLALMGRMP